MERVIAVNTDFSVVEVCSDFLVINKPAPLIVHPTNTKPEPTLLGELNDWLAILGEETGSLSIINRLDRETSGLVLVARNPKVARTFGKEMMRKQISKKYLAIVWGWPDWDRQEVNAPLIRRGEVEESSIWVMQAVHESGKPSQTQLSVRSRFEREGEKFSILEAETQTGRTHQIRVHCAYVEHPLVGDKIYGGSEQCYLEYIESGWSDSLAKSLLLERHALHASELSLAWEGKTRTWQVPLPKDMADFSKGL